MPKEIFIIVFVVHAHISKNTKRCDFTLFMNTVTHFEKRCSYSIALHFPLVNILNCKYNMRHIIIVYMPTYNA